MSRSKLDYLGVSAFCESMAMMVQAGISTDEAIGLLRSEKASSGGVLEQALTVMKEKVDEGAGLAAAMKESGVFPDYALQMVEAGERSGRDRGRKASSQGTGAAARKSGCGHQTCHH